MTKLCFIDVETTGLSAYKNAIVQLSGAIVIDGVVKENFNYEVAPHDGAIIDAKALAISARTESQVIDYPSSKSVYKEFTSLLLKYVNKYKKKDKFHFIAYNAKFDSDFIRQFFYLNGDQWYGSYFWTPYIDLMTIAGIHLMGQRESMVNFKLNTVAAKMGVVVDETKLHDAEYDIFLTMQLFHQLTSGLPKFDTDIMTDRW